MTASASGLDLYWIPLGAGQRVVRTSGKLYERLVARAARRPRRDLYHSRARGDDGGRSRDDRDGAAAEQPRPQ